MRAEPRPAAGGTPRLVRPGALAIVLVAGAYLTVALARGGYSPSFQAAAGAVVWWVVIVGLAFHVLPRSPVPAAALAAGTALAGLALLTALSAGWATDDGRVVSELTRVTGYLGVFCLVVLASPRGGARAALLGLAGALAAVAALALGSRFLPFLFPEQDLARFLPDSRARLAYPFNYWNGLAAAMGAGMALLTWATGNARSAAGRALAAGALPLPALVIFLTSSRGGALAALVGLVVVLVAARERIAMALSLLLGGAGGALAITLTRGRDEIVDGRLGTATADAQGAELTLAVVLIAVAVAVLRLVADRPLSRLRLRPPSRPVAAAFAATALIAVVAVGTAAGAPERLERLTDPPSPNVLPQRGSVERHLVSDSGSGRVQFWEAGWEAFRDRPLGGLGAGGYQAWWLQTGPFPYALRDAHSWFVESLAELGLFGLVLSLTFLLAGAVAGVLRRLRPEVDHAAVGGALGVLAAGALSAAIDWTWELPAAFLLVVVAVALLTGPATAGRDPTRSRFAWGLATLAAAWVGLLVSAVVLVGHVKLSDSRQAAREGDLRQAVEDAASARTVAPWAAEPRLQAAIVAERGGDLRLATREIDDAIERAPRDWRLWLVSARIRTNADDVQGGARALGRARVLNPRSPIFRPTIR